MRFEYPQLLWLLLAMVPGLGAFLWWAWRRKRQLIAQFVQSRLLANLTVGVSTARQKARMVMLVLAVALVVVVLARPQLGFQWEEARQRGLDIVVALDTSRSMLAEDVAPNRLARAKLAALDLRKLARADRMGLVAFAGTAFLQCPLTLDDEAFRQSVNELNARIIPHGGSALAEAISAAAAAFKEKNDNYKVLVLFTDGEDNDGRALEAAQQAEGLRIFTVGVGTPNGELLRVVDEKGRGDYIKDEQGNVVKSRLNEPLLQQIAQSTGGFYLLLSGANSMELLYERGLAPLPKTEFAARQVKRHYERYQCLLGLVIVLLLVEMFLPERKLVRRSETILAGSANAELRKAVAVALAVACPLLSSASSSRARKEYEAGRFNAAQSHYERLLEKRASDPKLHFNAGTSAFQAKDYDAAQSHFNAALVTQDVPLQQRSYYNLGNTQYRLGEGATDLKEKQGAWQQAVRSYENALKLDAQDQDAKFNLDLVKKKLEELKQQQEQQQQQQQQDKQDPKEQSDQSKQGDQSQDKQPKPQENQADKPPEEQKSTQPQEQPPKPSDQSQPQPQESQTKNGQQNEAQQKEQGAENEQTPAGNEGQPLRMTPQQAARLLEAQKSEERILIFLPRSMTNQPNRVLKDW